MHHALTLHTANSRSLLTQGLGVHALHIDVAPEGLCRVARLRGLPALVQEPRPRRQMAAAQLGLRLRLRVVCMPRKRYVPGHKRGMVSGTVRCKCAFMGKCPPIFQWNAYTALASSSCMANLGKGLVEKKAHTWTL